MTANKATLYIVSTPIGNLDDITQRALSTLAAVDLIAAEDTRHSKKLLNHYHISTPMTAYHAHNEAQQSSKLLAQLEQGKSIALISDAGTPLISDPGFDLIRAAQMAGIEVVPIPGPSAVVTAISASGLPCDQFFFAGFLPVKSKPRETILRSLLTKSCTVILYEAPHRIRALLALLAELEPMREVCVAKELTKHYEQFIRGTTQMVQQKFESSAELCRGEFVVMIAGLAPTHIQDQAFDSVLKPLLSELSLTQAVKLTVKITGLAKNVIYERALELQKSTQ